ncbi:MAG: hypothetical protein JW967_09120 [Dehalococcoidales bacterium]|nr:hypothetical protein [Dehalococcoidales bacterium]
MSWPPYLLKIRIENEDNSFPIWLPLFIIGPIMLILLLAVLIILLPFVLLSLIFTWQLGWWRPVFLFFPALFRIIAQLPGLKVDVGSHSGRVYIAFI